MLQLAGPALGGAGHLGHLHAAPGEALNIVQLAALAGLGQRNGHTLAAGTTDAADAVHVRLRCRRHVVVDDVGEVVDIETTSGHVGGHQQVGDSTAQAAHHLVALLLVQTAVQSLGPVATAVHRLGQLVNLHTGSAEHQRRLGRLDVENPAERSRLVCPVHHVHPLRHQWGPALRRCGIADADAHRITEVTSSQTLDASRHGRREQHRLAVAGAAAQQLVEVVGEAHVEHLVGLVEHHHLEVIKRKGTAMQVIDRSAGRRHHHVDATVQTRQLPPDGLAPVDRQHSHTQTTAVLVDRLGYLHRQLAGGAQHQGLRRLAGPIGQVDAAEDRQGERCSLAGTCGRLTDQVVAGHDGGDRLRLNRGGFLVAEFAQRLEEFPRKIEGLEARQLGLGLGLGGNLGLRFGRSLQLGLSLWFGLHYRFGLGGNLGLGLRLHNRFGLGLGGNLRLGLHNRFGHSLQLGNRFGFGVGVRGQHQLPLAGGLGLGRGGLDRSRFDRSRLSRLGDLGIRVDGSIMSGGFGGHRIVQHSSLHTGRRAAASPQRREVARFA